MTRAHEMYTRIFNHFIHSMQCKQNNIIKSAIKEINEFLFFSLFDQSSASSRNGKYLYILWKPQLFLAKCVYVCAECVCVCVCHLPSQVVFNWARASHMYYFFHRYALLYDTRIHLQSTHTICGDRNKIAYRWSMWMLECWRAPAQSHDCDSVSQTPSPAI